MTVRTERRRYYLYYTLAFALVALIAFSPFYLQGLSLVRGGDGHYQHTKALAFYSRWLRSFFRAVFAGDWGNLPLWTFSTGYGANVIGTFHYYVLGDPFALAAAFVGKGQIVDLYMILIFARLYAAGAAFSELCFYTGKRQTAAVLSGALCYVFTTNVFYLCVRHPFFCGAMVWFPLILLGAERILRERRYGLYIFSVFLCAVSNFYFFYMTVIFTVIYALWRTGGEFGLRRMREGISFLLRMAAASAVGLGMSMGVMLPVLRAFGASQRFGGGQFRFPDRHTLLWVKKWFTYLLSYRGQDKMGFAGVVVLGTVLLFLSRGKDRRWKILALIVMGACYSLFFQYLLSGFSYVNGRWLWGTALPLAYLLVVSWDRFREISRGQALCLLGVLAAFVLASRGFADRSMAWSTRIQAVLAGGFILLMVMGRLPLLRRGGRTAFLWQSALVLTVCLSCGAIGYFRYAPDWGGYSSEFRPYREYTSAYGETMGAQEKGERGEKILLKTEAVPVARYLGAEQAFRYSSIHNLTANASVLEGTAADQFYWSMGNRYIADWLRETAAMNYEGQNYSGVQGRMMLLALTGVRYVYAEEPLYAPYGYERISAETNPMDEVYPFYRNRIPLSLGICFDRYISREAYAGMDAVQRQQAFLQGVVLAPGDVPDGLKEARPEFAHEDIPYEMTAQDGVTIEGEKQFKVTRAGGTLRFSIRGERFGETYLYLTGLTVREGKSKSGFSVTGNRSDGTAGRLDFFYLDDEHKWSDRKHDYLVHTGYSGESCLTSFDLSFAKPGIYSFSDIRVICQPLEEAESRIRQLSAQIMRDIDFHADGTTFSTSHITGHVEAKQKSVLFLSIPWEKGWIAEVDGEKTELFQADTGFCGLVLEAGEHQIGLRYVTPGLKSGALISLVSFCLWIAALVWERRREKHTP